MPRHARIISAAGTYHVTQRGNNREPIFLERPDYQHYLGLLATVQKKHPFDLFHYVLMPNHIHLILRSRTSATITPAMKWVSQVYSRRFNAYYGKSGHLWGDRFFSKEIDTDGYLLTAGIYVELNPVRAGLVTSPLHYPWSSYAFYAKGNKNPLLSHSSAYQSLHADKQRKTKMYVALADMWRDGKVSPWGQSPK